MLACHNLYYRMASKILGIGIDIVELSRIERLLKAEYLPRFITRVLHPR